MYAVVDLNATSIEAASRLRSPGKLGGKQHIAVVVDSLGVGGGVPNSGQVDAIEVPGEGDVEEYVDKGREGESGDPVAEGVAGHCDNRRVHVDFDIITAKIGRPQWAQTIETLKTR